MSKKNKKILNCKIINIKKFKDDRGIFFEKYNKNLFYSLGIKFNFVQDNISISKKNVIRGLHFQKKYKQGKLVSVSKGKIFDVVVDLRRSKSTFGKVSTFILSDKDQNLLWVPPGFAHGFCAMSKSAIVEYKCTDFYSPKNQFTLLWNDKFLNIKWPTKKPIISNKDKFGITFKDLMKNSII
jgi:dTDP-4-dehydrorhamnose 3,5-epimerase